VFRTLISNCPKRKRPQSFCGKSHFTTTMHRLGQSICFTGSTRQPSVAISLRCIAADTPGRRMPSPHRGNATRLRATGQARDSIAGLPSPTISASARDTKLSDFI
jgi:hypothetical protein